MEKQIPKPSTIRTLVLLSGEEIVAEVSPHNDSQHILVSKPHRIYVAFVPTPQGIMPVTQLLPAWRATGQTEFVIDKSKLLVPYCEPPKALQDAYLEATSGLKLKM